MIHTTVHLFAGFLGVGKTTALRHLIANRPAHEKWAVIVNEFGEVGIDGAALESEETPVAEIAGGCLCCVAGPQMTATVANLLRRARPDRLLIEASGLAHAAGVIDELRQKPLGDALTIGAVVTLVDPRQFVDQNVWRQPLYRDQVGIADVLVANKIDRCDVETLAAFRQQAEGLFPAKAKICEVRDGMLDVSVLDVEPVRGPYRPARVKSLPEGYQSQGWIFDEAQAFDGGKLTAFFDGLPALVPGLVRAKGVFNVLDTRVWLNWADGQWGATQVSWRRDSRFELIAPAFDAALIRQSLEACFE